VRRRLTTRLAIATLALAALAPAMAVGAGSAVAAPGPPQAPEWWFDSWHVPQLWAGGADGHGITIAVIDTGVDANLPELQGKVLPGADFIGNGSDGRVDYDAEAFSHGTAMTSILVASPGLGDVEGIAPGAQILPISVPLKGVVRHGTPPPSPTATAIDFAVAHGARIINMSLGGVRDQAEDGPDPCPASVQNSVLNAVRRGVLVVAASGNAADQNSPVEEPGVCLGVVSVGSVTQSLDVSAFSSRHPYLTISAPGDPVPSLARDGAYIGAGTSQATAVTSGALALIWSKYPDESARQILTRLLNTVTDRGPQGHDPAYGYGVINPEAAIAAIVPGSTAPNAVLDGARPLLLAQPAGAARTPKAMAAAVTAHPQLGSYQLGAAPARFTSQVYGAAAATLVLLVLGVLCLLRFRRRRSATPML
jgi:subtilisin family serine protease